MGLLVFALLIGLSFKAWRWMKIDKCLDRGGSWNYQQGVCEESKKAERE